MIQRDNKGKFQSAGDLTGQRNRMLTVIKLSNEQDKYGRRLWECLCDCGNTKLITTGEWNGKKIKSCGCLHRKNSRELLIKLNNSRPPNWHPTNWIDLTGLKFGRLTATEYLGHGKWLCQCSCGQTVIVLSYNLRSNNTKSCGCYKKEINKRPKNGKTAKGKTRRPKHDLRGQIFTRLTAVAYLGWSKWLCQCSCGQTRIVQTNHLRSKAVKSCGCLKHEPSNRRLKLVGLKFSRLLVIKSLGIHKTGQQTWLCLCECGEHVEVKGANLTSRVTKSCGCLQRDNRKIGKLGIWEDVDETADVFFTAAQLRAMKMDAIYREDLKDAS